MLQFKKSKPKSDKVATKNNKTNDHFFCQKYINKVFLRPILQNLKGRSVLDIFFENDPLDEPNQMPLSKKMLSFSKVGKKTK